MALAPGVRLGPYEVLAAIGKGGMGDCIQKAPLTRLATLTTSTAPPVSTPMRR